MRVCMLGSSLSGAVRKAYEALPPKQRCHVDVQFFANAGTGYQDIAVASGQISNTPYTTGGDLQLTSYDSFVVYGSMPTPNECLRHKRSLEAGHYSTAAQALALKDWIQSFKSSRLTAEIASLTNAPVLVLSQNYNIEDNIGTMQEYKEGCQLLQEAIAPAFYIPFPANLFLASGSPDQKYYKDSLNVEGIEPNRDIQPIHHHYHLNQQGGLLVLEQIFSCLATLKHGKAPLANDPLPA